MGSRRRVNKALEIHWAVCVQTFRSFYGLKWYLSVYEASESFRSGNLLECLFIHAIWVLPISRIIFHLNKLSPKPFRLLSQLLWASSRHSPLTLLLCMFANANSYRLAPASWNRISVSEIPEEFFNNKIFSKIPSPWKWDLRKFIHFDPEKGSQSDINFQLKIFTNPSSSLPEKFISFNSSSPKLSCGDAKR